MSSYVVLRLLDSFFRHKFLHVLPIIAFTALGVWYLATQEVEYQAKGVLLVEDETLLTSLTELGGDGGWGSPASRVETQVNSLLQTGSFVSDVAAKAGLGSDLRPDQLGAIQSSIGAFSAGENLVHVWSNDVNPEAARDKAAATIDGLIQFNIDSAIGDSAAAQGVLDPLTEQYRRDLDEARQKLAAYFGNNPAPQGNRSAEEQVQIDQLTTDVAEANARYTDALEKEESARLAKEQATNAIQDRFQVVDEPQVPSSPLGRMRTKALVLAVFILVGGILAGASVVLGAALDQTVRYPQDISFRLGARVLGVIPDTSTWQHPPPRREEPHGFADDRTAAS